MEALAYYRTLILPECTALTPAQVAAIRGYLEHGGRVIATGELGADLETSDRAALLGHPHLLRTTDIRAQDFLGGPQVIVEPGMDLAINIHRIGDKEAAIHVIRYDYEEERDEVPALERMHIDVRLLRRFRVVKTFSPVGDVSSRLTYSREVREMDRIELEDVPLYTVMLLQG